MHVASSIYRAQLLKYYFSTHIKLKPLLSHFGSNLCIKLLLFRFLHQVKHVKHFWNTNSCDFNECGIVNPSIQSHYQLTVLKI